MYVRASGSTAYRPPPVATRAGFGLPPRARAGAGQAVYHAGVCTISSQLAPGWLVVTMNRDELLARPPERPPVEHPREGDAPAWVAPVDGQAGGTWFAANARGLVGCLINRYLPGDPEVPTPAGDRPSRGGILPMLVACGGYGEALAWLRKRFDPSPYAGFDLLVAAPDGRTLLTWDGEGPLRETPWQAGWRQTASSSWKSPEVLTWRHERFGEWLTAGAQHVGPLPTYHLLQPAGAEALAPLMRRRYAATRSITQAEVDRSAGAVTLRYWPAPDPARPDQPPAAKHVLPLCGE